jgi:hypothetical protein
LTARLNSLAKFTLPLMLLAVATARAIPADVLTLNCDGTSTDLSGAESYKPSPVDKIDLIVNLGDGVVLGVAGVAARIAKADAESVSFKGSNDDWTVDGVIDRATGVTTAAAWGSSLDSHDYLLKLRCKSGAATPMSAPAQAPATPPGSTEVHVTR